MTLNSQAYFTVSGENKMVRNIPLFLIVLVVSVKTYSGRENSYDRESEIRSPIIRSPIKAF